MRKAQLSDMIGGWFVGNFEPTLFHSEQFEVAVKYYKKGEAEARHMHKVATEFTVVVSGCVKMDGDVYVAGDIIEIEPGESTDFEALEDAITTVVKVPSAKGDKYVTND